MRTGQSQTAVPRLAPQRELGQAGQGAKNRLAAHMQVLLDRALVKNEISYTAVPDGDAFIATVMIPASEHNEAQAFQGEACSTEKDAENSAAQQAIAALDDLVQPLAEAKAAKRKLREQELAEERKRRRLEGAPL